MKRVNWKAELLTVLILVLVIGGICGTKYYQKVQNDKKLEQQAKNAEKNAVKEDLSGKKIGVQIGTTGDIYVSDYEKDGSGTTVERYNKGADAVQALKLGKIDAVVIDEQPAEKKAAEGHGEIVKPRADKLEYGGGDRDDQHRRDGNAYGIYRPEHQQRQRRGSDTPEKAGY